MKCKNKPCDIYVNNWICLCPEDNISVRQILESQFINGWISKNSTGIANKLAKDHSVSDERLYQMLVLLEEEANSAYSMWQFCQ